MPKIQWIGIIKNELSEYQKSAFSNNTHKMEMPASANELMLKALPFTVLPFLTIFVSMFIKTFLAGQIIIRPAFVVIGLAAGFIGLILHELLHAVCYPSDATVYVGIYLKAIAPVALTSYPLKRGRFIFMSLLPSILGIIPIAVFWFTSTETTAWNGFLFGFAVMGLISPYPDYYNIYQVLKQTPKKCRIQFYSEDTYWMD